MPEVVNIAAATAAMRKAQRQQALAPASSRQQSLRKWAFKLFSLTVAIVLALSIPLLIDWLEQIDELQWLVR